MKAFVFTPEGVADCSVRACLHTGADDFADRKRPVVVICPGGGYGHVSEREAEPVARMYYAAGYHTFILNYSIKEDAKDFKPLCQLAALVAHIRKNAKEWCVEENKIAVCGFSAGGHLAGSLGTLYKEARFLEVFQRTENVRPDAMILAYPVITSDEYAHVGSLQGVSGSPKGSELYQWFGLDQHVDENTPPTFMWHTAPDTCVPVENSIKMAAALSNAKVPFEYHVFPCGYHGMSVCTDEVGSKDDYNARWMDWSIQWLKQLFAEK